ncbi:VapC toxin family PIN domain ribonuclease [Halobacteriales archaeon QS_8_65_32]|nr:MAG: VapC toxin family PIN domain ribonuclease [Halobacteriales archaeon QS_8_65_32]
MIFIDSWVWLELSLEGDRRRAAGKVVQRMRNEGGVIATTVLMEVGYRLRRQADARRANRVLAAIRRFESLTIEPVTTAIALDAIEIRDKYYERRELEVSYADAVHVATAVATGCDRLYSGDPDFEDIDELDTVIVN